MNYHTAKMTAQKHGFRCLRDEDEKVYLFEDARGTPVLEIGYDSLRDMTTYALEVRLGVHGEAR